MSRCGLRAAAVPLASKLLFSQAAIIDDAQRGEDRFKYPDTFLLALLLPPRLLDLRVLGDLLLVLVLGVVQQVQDVLPRLSQLMFEHVWAGGGGVIWAQ